MDRSIYRKYLLVVFMISSTVSSVFCQEANKRNKTERVIKNERRVIFPVFNDTRPYLPVFPDPIVEYVGKQRPLAPPVDKFGQPLCLKQTDATFCENVDNYPDNEIRKAISYSATEFKELFGTQTIHSRKMFPTDLNEETVCSQHTRMFYPKAAVNENDQWAYVVNDVDYIQAVMAEICESEDKPCTYLDGALPAGVSSRCRQKYAYKKLLALHPNQKRTYTDSFRFPSCCVCFVKRPFILSRSREIRLEDKKTNRTES